MTQDNRDSFQSKFGFILACVGSAVGMGNIWMFPYRVAECGGSAFLIPYIIFVAVFFAGITSLVNLFESPVEALQTKCGLSRKASVAIIAAIGRFL